MYEQPPIIDIGSLDTDDASAWQSIATQIDRACSEWRGFYIKGHPITASRIDAVLDCAKRFFALPTAEKLKIDITQTRHHRGSRRRRPHRLRRVGATTVTCRRRTG